MVKKCLPMIIAAAIASRASAREMILAMPEASVFPDGEATTNIVIAVVDKFVRQANIEISYSGGISNALIVAFGKDANHDDVLALEETDARIKCAFGIWHTEDTPAGAYSYKEASPHFSAHLRDGDGKALLTWNNSWDMIRVTRRGNAQVSMEARLETLPDGFLLRVR